jgi:CheY-like chemotaxis protein
MIAPQGIRAMSLTTIRVLLVEDEIMIRMMVADMVEELGHAVAAEAGDFGRAAWLKQDCSIWPFSMSI